MSTAVISAATSDGDINSNDADYVTARAGSSPTADPASGTMIVGQRFTTQYRVSEGFVSFDTSGLSNIESVVLSLYIASGGDSSTTDFTVEARASSWTAGGLTAADYVPGASLSAQTLLATFATSGIVLNQYNDFVSESTFASALNLGGTTEIVLASANTAAGTAPTGNEFITPRTADNPGATPPRLTVTYDVRKLQTVTSPMRW